MIDPKLRKLAGEVKDGIDAVMVEADAGRSAVEVVLPLLDKFGRLIYMLGVAEGVRATVAKLVKGRHE